MEIPAMHRLLPALLVILVCLCSGCKGPPPPPDKKGKLPQDVLKEAIQAMIQGDYEKAEAAFTSDYLDKYCTKGKMTFQEYCEKNTMADWQKDRPLHAEAEPSKVGPDMWRVEVFYYEKDDTTRGTMGSVKTMKLIDGEYKVVDTRNHTGK
jgi:hypothetical protein